MPLIRSLVCFFFIVIFFSCKKDSIVKNEDKFVEEAEQLTGLELVASAVGQDFIELSWEKVSSNHYKTISYTVYLNDEQIVSKLNNHKYSLIKLRPGQEYTIKVAALTNDGLKTERTLVTRTLPEDAKQIDQVFYKEYNIHSYSTIHPHNLARFADGGICLSAIWSILITSCLTHSNFLFIILITRAIFYGID